MRNNNNVVYVFIDSQNLNLSIKDQGWKLDFKKFSAYLKNKYNVAKMFLFVGYVPENQSLYKFLQESGYILIFKPTLGLPSGKVKGNVDAELVLHAMLEWDNYDKAIIVSGDGDFYCLVEHLVKENKLFKLIIPNQLQFSSLFRKFMKYILFASRLKKRLEYK